MKKIKKLQVQSYKNFLTDKYFAQKLIIIEKRYFKNNKHFYSTKQNNDSLKILHVTNFNERHEDFFIIQKN